MKVNKQFSIKKFKKPKNNATRNRNLTKNNDEEITNTRIKKRLCFVVFHELDDGWIVQRNRQILHAIVAFFHANQFVIFKLRQLKKGGEKVTCE